jgi:general secretion pathway protein D
MRRCGQIVLCILIGITLTGCPKKGGQDYKAGEKALDLKDYDAAVDYYSKALQAEPNNAAYRIKLNQSRFEAGQFHIHQGVKLREKGDLQGALSQFQRATILDPSSIVADQELKKSLEILADRARASQQEEQPIMENGQPALASQPPELKPLSRAPINLKMSNDSKIVFDTIAKLAGLTVIYDPDLQARRITTELNNVTLEQALDIVCLESKTFWKPITENIIMVIPDQTQKRRDYDEQVVRTFYLNNIAVAQDLTEVTTGLRQLLDLKRIQQVNAQSAIIVRDTPDKLALIDKIIKDIDKAKPEVIIQVEVLEARTDHLRNLGILPPQSTSVTINPNNTASTSSGSSTTSTPSNTITLTQLTHLNQNDVIFTIPSATANFLMTDSATKIIENPEIRAIDGQAAKLRIGDRVPVATGSYQAGVGVGTTAGAGFVNPLVNTQFQYIDVGVNIDVTPHVHPNRDVSMKLLVEVSSVTGYQNIGGIQQPIISQRKIEHEIRLKEDEVSILGGLIDRIDTKTLNGWPWLAKIPVMHYLFSTENIEHQDNEDIIVLIPHIVRMPDWTKANLRALYSGSETFPTVKKELDLKSPASNPAPGSGSAGFNIPSEQQATPAATSASSPVVMSPGSAPTTAAPPQVSGIAGPRIRFEPAALNLRPGQTATLGIVVENVSDLFSMPMMLQYNPAVINVEEVRHGGFLSGGTQEIAIVQRVDQEHGQAIVSATRQPNTPGVSGSGTLLGVVVKAVGPGTSSLSVVQINAKDSQLKPIPLVTSEATLRVQ